MPTFRAPVSATRDGRYRIRLAAQERELVRELCGELRELVRRDDNAVARLFPPAYRGDDDAADEFDRLMRPELRDQRLAALDTVARTLDEEVLDQEQAEAWCGSLNDLRLVLGERLGVKEDDLAYGIDPHDPRARQLALYGWLTYLQGAVVDALASRL
jgi:hypothetical protein